MTCATLVAAPLFPAINPAAVIRALSLTAQSAACAAFVWLILAFPGAVAEHASTILH